MKSWGRERWRGEGRLLWYGLREEEVSERRLNFEEWGCGGGVVLTLVGGGGGRVLSLGVCGWGFFFDFMNGQILKEGEGGVEK